MPSTASDDGLLRRLDGDLRIPPLVAVDAQEARSAADGAVGDHLAAVFLGDVELDPLAAVRTEDLENLHRRAYLLEAAAKIASSS